MKNIIQHLVEPKRLILAWNQAGRSRYAIGELVRTEDTVLLRYHPNSDDFQKALDKGMHPLIAFRKENQEYAKGVMDFFMSRITSRKREDFDLYLETLGIDPSDKDKISDFALLGYGEARLPNDGFHVVNDYADNETPVEFVTELSGVQYGDYAQGRSQISNLTLEMPLSITHEPENNHDPNAVYIHNDGKKIGYINRIQAKTVTRWIQQGKTIQVTLHRKNGRPSAPRLFDAGT